MYRFGEMVEMEGAPSSKPPPPPPQISDMFQKFALAFKTKTYELFAEDYSAVSASEFDGDVALLLDSAEEFIPDQKVVVMKPDSDPTPNQSGNDLIRALIPSLFATISSFEASYLQFQAAHVPEIDQTALELADKSVVSILMKLSEMKSFYMDSKRGLGLGLGLSPNFDFPAGSFLEFQVQENQSKLRVLETIVNSLQFQMDVKDEEGRNLKNKLDKIRVSNSDLSRKLAVKKGNTGFQVMLTIRVFEVILNDTIKSIRHFVKLLISLMQRANWDLEEAANSIHPGVEYSRKGHFRYSFLSYACLGMFHNFNKQDFNETTLDGDGNGYLRQLIEHVAINPMEILSKNPKCGFSRFCERKYEELIHPTMESSVFSHLDRKVLDSWKSMAVFYEAFVRMASSVWLLHKLAYSFEPAVEIFQVEKGAEFSVVYMEGVLGKCYLLEKNMRPRVEFTVVPGFKVGRTVFQSQVYLAYSKHTE